ncbi:MAG: outer membrane lipoprotein carrier protein LolA [Pseudomonadota bacterium]|nr:MAG: outer membrane lipoprotein carrier protein LolA [Pseudomonadota bacterium]
MTSGPMTFTTARARGTLIAVLLFAQGTATAQRGDTGWDVAALAQILQARPAASARFSETRFIELLDEPLALNGILRYQAPDYVRKEVLAPYHEVFEARGDQLFHESEDRGRQSFLLDEHLAVRAFVEAFRATLGGKLDVLQRYYTLKLGGDQAGWSLQLRPLDRDMKKVVSTITIHGAGAEVARIESLETGGDLSVMTIQPDGE